METGVATALDLQSLIFVIDDDADLRRLIGDFLAGHGYRVRTGASVAELRSLLDGSTPDLIVMDVMMPGEDGLSAVRSLAERGGPPVIMLSALGSDTDRIIGLEVGADDYLAKPCNPRELLARVRVQLRRRAGAEVVPAPSQTYEFAGWRLDMLRRDLRDPAGVLIDLSDGEFAVLRAFVEHPQRVLSRDQLRDFARKPGIDVFDRAIDSQISRLRRKLNERVQTELIRTVRNEGYMWLPAVLRR